MEIRDKHIQDFGGEVRRNKATWKIKLIKAG
jgi:hypothetical protein